MIFSQIRLCGVPRQVIRTDEPLQPGENVLTEQFGQTTVTHTFTAGELIGSGNGEYIYAISDHTAECSRPEEDPDEEDGENVG